MKRFLASVLAIVLLISCSPLSAMQVYAKEGEGLTLQEGNVVAQSITVTTLPIKTEYVQGADTALDVSGGEITVTYSDKSTETVAMTAEMVSGFNMETVGDVTLTVSYAGLTANFTVTVSERPTGESVEEKYSIAAQNAVTIASEGTCGDNLTWTLDAEGLLTVSGIGSMESYNPTDYYVPWFSVRESIKKVVIESGITNIGSWTFYGCSVLSEIVIPESVTSIGDGAFQECTALESIAIPDGVTSIGDRAFECCSGLTSMTIPDGVTHIGGYAFSECYSLSQVNIPDGITRIESGTFRYCKFTSIVIPESVTYIGGSAFLECTALESIAIPNSVETIWQGAFSGCSSLKNITLPDNLSSIANSTFAFCTKLESIVLPESLTDIDMLAFSGCSNLTDITFLGDAPEIDDSAFQNVAANVYYPCNGSNWTNETMNGYGGALIWNQYHSLGEWGECKAATCTEKGEEARTCASCGIVETREIAALGHTFENGICTVCGEEEPVPVIASGTCGTSATWALTSDGILTISGTGAMSDYLPPRYSPWYSLRGSITNIVINEGITSIGYAAFSNCNQVTSVQLPSSLESISSSAFEFCSSLRNIHIPDGVTTSSFIFYGCDLLADEDGYIILDNCLYEYIGESLFLSIPDGVKTIKTGALLCNQGNDVLAISIPDSVEIMESGAMEGGPAFISLKVLAIGNGLHTLPDYAFTSCTSLESVTLPQNLESIPNGLFNNCSSLKEISIPETVTAIGQGAFNGCSSLQSIVIPKNVTDINNYAFDGCSSLTEIVLPPELKCYPELGKIDNLEKIILTGSWPGCWTYGSSVKNYTPFYGFDCDIYYIEADSTWTPEIREWINTGATVQWKAYCHYDWDSKCTVDHNCADYVLTKDATCTEPGEGIGTCSICGIEVTQEITVLGHDEISHEAKAPTCSDVGWNAYVTCSRCDYTTYEEIPALGHDLIHHDAKAPTETEIGWLAYDTCSRCDYTTYQELAPISVTVDAGGDIDYTVSGHVVTVNHEVACKVGYLSDGKCVAVPSVANDDGTYSFTIPDGVTDVVLVVAGDSNGDGKFTSADYGRLNAALLGKVTLTPEATFAADVNGDGKLTSADYGRLNAVLLGKLTLAW